MEEVRLGVVKGVDGGSGLRGRGDGKWRNVLVEVWIGVLYGRK